MLLRPTPLSSPFTPERTADTRISPLGVPRHQFSSPPPSPLPSLPPSLHPSLHRSSAPHPPPLLRPSPSVPPHAPPSSPCSCTPSSPPTAARATLAGSGSRRPWRGAGRGVGEAARKSPWGMEAWEARGQGGRAVERGDGGGRGEREQRGKARGSWWAKRREWRGALPPAPLCCSTSLCTSTRCCGRHW